MSAFFVLLLAACGGGADPVSPPAPPPPPPPPGPAPVATVTVTPGAPSLVPQETTALTATLKDAQGNVLTGRTIAWSSNAPATATVDPASGLVTGVGAGTATIAAATEGKTGSATVTVRDGGVIGAAGGQASGASGNVTVVVPPQAVAANTPISIAPVPDPQPDPKLVPGTAFDFGPDGTTFAQPVTLRIKYPATLPAGLNPGQLRIHKLNGTVWTVLPGSTVDVATRTVSAQTTSFSTYAVLEVAAVAPPPAPSLATGTLVVGGAHACGLTAAGDAWCWGSNSAGQLGDGTLNSTATPVRAAPAFKFTQLTAGSFFTCGITNTGAVKCWGFNHLGFFGDGSNGNQGGTGIATYILPEPATYINGIHDMVCTVTVSGANYCSGHRLVSGGPSVTIHTPEKIPGTVTFTQMVPGDYRACGLGTDQKVYCWGSGLGVAVPNNSTPTLVPLSGPAIAVIQAGDGSLEDGTCALLGSGELWCWGNQSGQFGDGNSHNTAIHRAGNGMLFSRVTGLNKMMCGLNGTTWYCWGRGFLFPDGQVHPVPQAMAFTGTVVNIAGHDQLACTLQAGGSARCGGTNYEGALGRGYLPWVTTPQAITGGPAMKAVAVGAISVCSLSTSGDPWCWGYLNHDTDTPARIATGLGLTSVTVGFAHACGLDGTGKAWCWGDNDLGQLGNGGTAPSATPVAVQTATRFTAIGATDEATCAIATDQTIWCWGRGGAGNVIAPHQRSATLKVTALNTGGSGNCAIEATGVYCWDFANGNPVKELFGSWQSVGHTRVVFDTFGHIETQLQMRCGIQILSGGGRNVFCDGVNQSFLGPAMNPLPPVVSVVAADYHVCFLDAAGKAYCWGATLHGALGGGALATTSAFVAVSTAEDFRMLGAATYFQESTTCGVSLTNVVYCWGDGSTNRLGRGLPHTTSTFGAVTGGQIFRVTPP